MDDNETRFMSLHRRYSLLVSVMLIITILSGVAVLTAFTVIRNYNLDRFWINQGVKYASIALIQFICGIMVRRGLKVNYSRKIVHICYFFIPQLLDTELIEFDKSLFTELWNIAVIFILLLGSLEIIRKYISVFQIMFEAIDRPEDRPFTTFWFMTQLVVSLPIIAGFSVLFSNWEKDHYIFIPLLIVALGDGLAEPVGTKWGYHKYKVKGLCVNREYTRSIQGSMCVTFFSVVAIIIYYPDFNKASITCALLSLPVFMTLTEAFSPHTWDNPLLLLTGYTLLVISYYVGTL